MYPKKSSIEVKAKELSQDIQKKIWLFTTTNQWFSIPAACTNPLEVFSETTMLGVRPGHWQLLTTSQVISLCRERWDIVTERKESKADSLHSYIIQPLSLRVECPAERFSRRSFMAEACSQPHPEQGARANNSRLPSGLLAALGCLIGFRIPPTICCQSKNLGKLKWNPSICLCGKKLGVYAEKMSLAFDKAALEMPLSVLNRPETSWETSALHQEPICWISP